jgi:hypothetical protein
MSDDKKPEEKVEEKLEGETVASETPQEKFKPDPAVAPAKQDKIDAKVQMQELMKKEVEEVEAKIKKVFEDHPDCGLQATTILGDNRIAHQIKVIYKQK